MIRRVLIGALRSPSRCSPRPPRRRPRSRAPIQAFDTPTFRTIWAPQQRARAGRATRSSGASPSPATRTPPRTTSGWSRPGRTAAAARRVSYEAPKATRGRQHRRHVPVLLLDPRRPDARRHERHGRGRHDRPGPAGRSRPPWTDPDWVDPDDPSAARCRCRTRRPRRRSSRRATTTAPTARAAQGQAETEARAAKVKVDVSEAGVADAAPEAAARRSSRPRASRSRRARHAATIKPPKALQDRARRYKLAGLGDRHGRDRLRDPLGLGGHRPMTGRVAACARRP